MHKIEGKIVRVIRDKRFGFIRAGKYEYFFHAEDLENSAWDALCDRFDRREDINVDCIEVESKKGPRVGEVRIV